ncbi:MAG: hypothetical protein ACREQ2_00860 [Candidatus Binatia bacterium]
MKAKFLTVVMLVGLMGLVGGCHYGSDDDHDYGNGYGYGSYRDDYRDGRTYERRRDDWRNNRYNDHRDYYRRRW